MADKAMEKFSTVDRLLKDRIVWLGSEVRDDMANDICAKILLLAAEDSTKDIYLYINSPGGSITAGMAIYDTMQYVPNDIVTVGIGMAASMGQFLLSSGTKGKRYATPNTRVLLHQPAQITADQTGKTVEQVMEDGDRDRWFTAQEALDYGFIDHIQASAGAATGVGTK
jgi:ATP-dependent Clp protease protease subunit